MKNFGEIVRELRVAQNLGLRETALKLEISPAYLSRIERGKEHPPKPNIIKKIAKVLAADPDVLFRLASSTDPEIASYLHEQPELAILLRHIKQANFTGDDIKKLVNFAEGIKAVPHTDR